MPRPPKYASDDDVLDRAIELFWVRGADAVTIRDLEGALDLKAPSIYRRFENRDRLLARCVDRYVDRVIGGRVRHLLDEAADPLDGVHEFFTSVLQPHPGEADLRGCLLTNTAAQVDASTPIVGAALDRGFETVRAGLRRAVERAVADRLLRDDVDIEATTTALQLSFQGLLIMTRNGSPNLETSIEVTLAALLPRRGAGGHGVD